MGRPVIGICAALERAQLERLGQAAALLPRNYVEAVQRAGGLRADAAPRRAAAAEPAAGAGADRRADARRRRRHRPRVLRSSRRTRRRSTRFPSATRFEIALARAAIERDLPVLGDLPRHAADQRGLRRHARSSTCPSCSATSEHRRVLGSFDGAEHDVMLHRGLARGERRRRAGARRPSPTITRASTGWARGSW